MDTGRPFSYVFEDSSWVSKVLIGGLLSLTIILSPSMIGYLIDTARNVRDGRELPLPEWGEDFGGRWVRGFSLIIILLIWSLVIFLPIACITAVLVALAAAAAGGGGDTSAVEGAIASISLLLNCLSFPLSLVIIFFQPAIFTHYIDRGTFGAGFEVGAIWRRMSRNWSNYIILALLFFVASLISGAGAIACFIGVIFTYPYAALIEAHLLGQFAREEPAAGTLTTDPL